MQVELGRCQLWHEYLIGLRGREDSSPPHSFTPVRDIANIGPRLNPNQRSIKFTMFSCAINSRGKIFISQEQLIKYFLSNRHCMRVLLGHKLFPCPTGVFGVFLPPFVEDAPDDDVRSASHISGNKSDISPSVNTKAVNLRIGHRPSLRYAGTKRILNRWVGS